MKLIMSHLGLGDHIAFADLIVRLADGKDAALPCWQHNEVSVKSIFVNHPNIKVVPILTDLDTDQLADDCDEHVLLGYYSNMPREEGEDSIQWVYRTAGMDPSVRFENDVVRKATDKEGQITKSGVSMPSGLYSFVHRDMERGFDMDHSLIPIKNRLYPYPSTGAPILAWATILSEANEVHVIDSAFLHLSEQLNPRGKLVYHKYARPNSESYKTLRHPWTVLQ